MTPTPGPWAVTLKLYNGSGLLVRSAPAGLAGAAPASLSISSDPWDASAGPLRVSAPGFQADLGGTDDSGGPLANGAYLLVAESRDGSSLQTASIALSIASSGAPPPFNAAVLPNPAPRGSAFVDFFWFPASQALSVHVYNQAGERLAQPALATAGRARWELGGAANGVYLAVFRIPGQRHPRLVKVALAR